MTRTAPAPSRAHPPRRGRNRPRCSAGACDHAPVDLVPGAGVDAREFNAAVRKQPDSKEAWNELAGMLILLNDFPQALAALDRLKALGWQHVLVARDVRRTGDAGLYQMIYASNHPAGGRIARWSADRPDDNQQSLF